MSGHFREHYSQNFHLKTNKLPTKATDRFSLSILFVAFVFGLLAYILGAYRLNPTWFIGETDFENTIAETKIQFDYLISPFLFSVIMMILGAGIVLVSVFYDLRRKKIYFDGSKIIVTDHPIIGKPHTFTEKLSNYEGVRLRLKFCQYGILNKNKFIVELYHKDQSKIVPLYISTNPKNVRSIWKEYALEFHLPPIHISEKGMVSRQARDMDKSYVDVVKSWNLPKNFLLKQTHSQDFICKQKQEKIMIKAKRVIIDVYAFLNIFTVFLLGGLLFYAFLNHQIILHYVPLYAVLFFYALLLALIVFAYLSLIVKDRILIHQGKIVVFRCILFMTFQEAVINFSSLRGVDINYTPTTDRYALNILTDKGTVVVFNKFSPEDLRWIRGLIISQIIA